MNIVRFLVAAVGAVFLTLPGLGWAETNAVKQVQVRRDGDRVLIKVQMQEPIKAIPGNWSVIEPPRIVFDFPGAENQTGGSAQQVAAGDLKSLNVVQAENLTRLVLNLYRPTKFSTEIDGSALLIKLESTSQVSGGEPLPSTYVASTNLKPENSASRNSDASVRDLVFRRGEDGQAIVMLELSDGTLPVDVKRTASGLAVEISGVELPERLQTRRDVIDFATPVTYLSAQAQGTAVRLDIAAKGRWFHQAQVTNNRLTIEIKPITEEEANKLVQVGQQGQKVSINFYDAEATMVLRTLAEISGKNVMIDPSMTGKRVTVSLDGIPYDQALEIVMAQVGASMRIRNDVVLFGDRAVLQKRDQDQADELARASDTAPLVAETFELNYLKVADISALISNTLNTNSVNGPAAAPSQPAPAGQTAPAGSKGLLSARGTMTMHEPSNKLFVRDTAERIDEIRKVIRSVDIPARQVLIEARIVRADTTFNRDLGMRLGFQDLSTAATGGIGTRIGRTNTFVSTGATNPTGTQTDLINLPAAANGQFAISVFNSSLTKFINLELQAAENEGRSVSISSPRVVTANNLEAKISRGQRIPYQTVSAAGATPSTAYLDATLSLTVKPQIAPNGTVILELQVTNNSPAAGNALNVAELKTKVTVENGGTVVLGGVITDDTSLDEKKIPYLSDLPWVGNFFKRTTKSSTKGELLVFITPRILDQAINQVSIR